MDWFRDGDGHLSKVNELKAEFLLLPLTNGRRVPVALRVERVNRGT
jgi:hypothetical protein